MGQNGGQLLPSSGPPPEQASFSNNLKALSARHSARVPGRHPFVLSSVSSLAIAWVAGDHAVFVKEVQDAPSGFSPGVGIHAFLCLAGLDYSPSRALASCKSGVSKPSENQS